MVPAAPWVLRMAIWNCPGMHGPDGVAEGVDPTVGVGSSAVVAEGVGPAWKGVGSMTVADGDDEPHAASTPADASTRHGTRVLRIATQRTRNPPGAPQG